MGKKGHFMPHFNTFFDWKIKVQFYSKKMEQKSYLKQRYDYLVFRQLYFYREF